VGSDASRTSRAGDERRATASADVLPPDVLDGGESVLVAGRSMVGKQRVGYRLLADAPRTSSAAYCVTTSDPADHARDRFDEVAPAGARLRVIDCLTGAGGSVAPGDESGDGGADADTWYVSSPGDLTGIGVAATKAIGATPEPRRTRSRVLIDSVSTLLLYADVETVYRFLHTLAGRVKTVDGHVVSVLHTDALDDRTRATLVQLFDLVVDVRSPDGTTTEVRVRGHPDLDGSWRPLDRSGGGGRSP
jgi:hypothetical protein